MAARWCVKITCLPEGINNDELASMFGIDRNTIDAPRNQQGHNYYAWVNGFSDHEQAESFVEKWNQIKIRSRTIICKTQRTKFHVLNRPPSIPMNNDNRLGL